MNCQQMRAHSALYLSDDLSPPDTTALHAHLNTCDACQAYHDEMREMMDDLQLLKSLDAPLGSLPSIQATVMASLEAPSVEHVWSWRPVAWGAAALLAVMIGTITILNGSEQEELNSFDTTKIFTHYRIDGQRSTVQPQSEFAFASATPGSKHSTTIGLASTSAEESPPLLVKFYTDDPDIVIYWFGD